MRNLHADAPLDFYVYLHWVRSTRLPAVNAHVFRGDGAARERNAGLSVGGSDKAASTAADRQHTRIGVMSLPAWLSLSTSFRRARGLPVRPSTSDGGREVSLLFFYSVFAWSSVCLSVCLLVCLSCIALPGA